MKLIDACERRVLEPPTTGLAALHSPRTAIVDYPAICGSLAREMKERGATVRTTAALKRVGWTRERPRLALEDGTSIDADRLLVRAGLHTDRLARDAGEPAARGSCRSAASNWRCGRSATSSCAGLVRPVPDPSLPFLGGHLTRTVGRPVLVGPSAVRALAREGYRRRGPRSRRLSASPAATSSLAIAEELVSFLGL